MGAVTWLHLSDWHHGHKAHRDSDRKITCDALLKDIRERSAIAPELARIDFIIFSGDIAWSGKAQEYQAAQRDFFEPLLEAAGLEDSGWSRLFVVPGNHDIDRDELSDESLHKLSNNLNNRSNVRDCLAIDWKVAALMSPFGDYSEFASKCGVGNETEKVYDHPAYSYVSSMEVGNGKRIAIIGLNSAWLSGRNLDSKKEVNDYGYLIAGENQVYSALRKVEDHDKVDLKIAVMHHPFAWLTEFDRDVVEDRLYRDCHFILHGHEHRPRVNVQQSTLGDVVAIPAGASYDRRLQSDPRYTNAYNFVHLDFEKEQGTVYLRQWGETQGKWIEDTNSWQESRFPFSMPKSTDSLDPVKREARRSLISKFAPDLRRRFCDELEVSINHTLEDHKDISLVESKVHYKIKVAPGPREPYRLCLFADSQVARLNKEGRVSIKPYDVEYFTVDGQDVAATSTTTRPEDGTWYETQLNEEQALIEFLYTQWQMLHGVYVVTVGQFTRHFKLTFVEEKRLEYEFLPLGGFPQIRPMPNPVCEFKQMINSELCNPHQGYLIQWNPPSVDALLKLKA